MKVCDQDGKPSPSCPTGLIFSKKGSTVLLSEEPVAIPEKWCFSTNRALLAVAAMGFLLTGAGGRDVL